MVHNLISRVVHFLVDKSIKKYLVEKKLIGSNKYVYYNAGTDDGEKLINSFCKHNHEFKVIEVDKRKYIILKDSRF